MGIQPVTEQKAIADLIQDIEDHELLVLRSCRTDINESSFTTADIQVGVKTEPDDGTQE